MAARSPQGHALPFPTGFVLWSSSNSHTGPCKPTLLLQASTASEWEALAAAYPDSDKVDEELAARINQVCPLLRSSSGCLVACRADPPTGPAVQVCNSGLRHMLRGDQLRVERFKDELSELGGHFGRQQHVAGATFC